MEKVCSRCSKIKPISEYSKNYTFCKECKRQSYRLNKQWRLNSNFNKMKRYHSDMLYKETCLLRKKLNDSWHYEYWTDKSSIKNILGVKSKQHFVEYIESLFLDGMTFKNYGKEQNNWQFDHIKPLSSAKTIKELHKLFHYKNTRPLWIKDNNEKRAN